MSLRPDGTRHCDRCGVDVGNGAIAKAAVLVDLDPYRVGQTRQLHLCRVNNCAALVISADNFPDYYAFIEGA